MLLILAVMVVISWVTTPPTAGQQMVEEIRRPHGEPPALAG